jgi:NAD(P)-dependent dehydrogenase (short-subunit alcohol dehydrogenase family)
MPAWLCAHTMPLGFEQAEGAMKIDQLFNVRGKVAIVTGGSRGIGEMIARGYVENGVKVYITARKADTCDALAKELSKFGECISIPADLSRMEEIERFATEIEKREKKIDILVNNAGASWGETFDKFPESGWDKVIDLNVKSVFFLSQRLAKLLEAGASDDDFARIINIGSIDGLHVSEIETYSYAASKAAVIHLTKMMAKYLAAKKIAVNAIAPGFFPSKMTKDLPMEKIAATTPMRRVGKPEDIAGLAIYLGSKASAFLCGAVIPIDGGRATTV